MPTFTVWGAWNGPAAPQHPTAPLTSVLTQRQRHSRTPQLPTKRLLLRHRAHMCLKQLPAARALPGAPVDTVDAPTLCATLVTMSCAAGFCRQPQGVPARPLSP